MKFKSIFVSAIALVAGMALQASAAQACTYSNTLGSRDDFDNLAWAIDHCTNAQGQLTPGQKCGPIAGDGKWDLVIKDIQEGLGTIRFKMMYNSFDDTFDVTGYASRGIIMKAVGLDSEKFTLISILRDFYLQSDAGPWACEWK